MEIVYRKVKIGRSDRQIKGIAIALYRSNRYSILMENIDPFVYLKGLKRYGINSKAKPLIKNKKIIGYKFSAS